MFCMLLKTQCLLQMLQIILMRSSKSQRMTAMVPGLLARKTGTVLSPLQPRLHVSASALPYRQDHKFLSFMPPVTYNCSGMTAEVCWKGSECVSKEHTLWCVWNVVWTVQNMVNHFLYMHGPAAVILCWFEKSFFFKCLVISPVWIYFRLLVGLWVGVSNFICYWMHTLCYFVTFVCVII